jgi:hypothetical protein
VPTSMEPLAAGEPRGPGNAAARTRLARDIAARTRLARNAAAQCPPGTEPRRLAVTR